MGPIDDSQHDKYPAVKLNDLVRERLPQRILDLVDELDLEVEIDTTVTVAVHGKATARQVITIVLLLMAIGVI